MECFAKIPTYGTFSYFAKWNFFMFLERELFSLIIQEVTFRAQKKTKKKKKTEPTLKERLIFQRMELFSSKLKKLLISIQEELTGSENEKILIFFSNTSANEKGFLYFSL